jgi:WD40 repeat protein
MTGSGDGTAKIWGAESGQQIRTFAWHTQSVNVNSVAFSPDGRSVLLGDESFDDRGAGSALLCEAASGRLIRAFQTHSNAVNSVAFSPDGRYVLTGNGPLSEKSADNDRVAQLWDVATGRKIRSFTGHRSRVRSVAFSPDGLSVLTGSDDSSARLWEAASGKQLRMFTGYTSVVSSVAFSPDGRSVLTGGYKMAVAWDLSTGQKSRSFLARSTAVESGTFSKDGRYLLTQHREDESQHRKDESARLWDVATGAQVHSLSGHEKASDPVAFSQDGRFVVTSDPPKEGLFEVTSKSTKATRLWDMGTGRQIRSYLGPIFSTSVALSPDGSSVLIGGYTIKDGSKDFEPLGATRLLDTVSGRPLHNFSEQTGIVYSAAFSPDGRSLLTGSGDGIARLWDPSTGLEIRPLAGQTRVASTGFLAGLSQPVTSAAFSQDGRYILTGNADGSARLWDSSTGTQLRSFKGHAGSVYSVSFSPDNRFVVTGSNDTTTRIWDTATGKVLAVLLSFDDGGWAVIDGQGRYDSNDPENTPGLIFVTDHLRTIGMNQLKDNYYTPNLLARIVAGERLPDVKGLNLVPAPPEVAIASPYEPETAHLKLNIANQGGGVGRLVVSVNDRKAVVLEHPVAGDLAGNTDLMVEMGEATLKPGENTVKAYAYDAGNQIRSHEAIATFNVVAKSKGLTLEASADTTLGYIPQFYGIVVGTTSYPGNQKLDLVYPAHDAESMMTGLEIGAGKLFGADNVHLRLLTTDAKDESDQPTKKNIVAAFADVMQKAKPTDVLLVYLSGHGVNLRTEKDSYYYLTTDARSLEIENNPALRDLSTVSSAELKQWLGAKNMPLKEALILDTCAAGAANDELLKLVEKREVPPDQRRAVEFLKESTGTIILMGSAADKNSYEASKYGQGLLTYALLKGMRGRSIEEGSRLNVSHWFQNASEDVPQLAQSIGGIQKPVIAAPSGTGFPVALLEPADQAKIPLAAIKPELIHLRCHDEDDKDPLGLEAAVREQLRELSHPTARGQSSEPPIVYHDDMTDGPADSLSPRIVYSVSGSMVNLRLRIEQAGKTAQEERLNLGNADKNALAITVAAKLAAMAEQVPLNDSKQ